MRKTDSASASPARQARPPAVKTRRTQAERTGETRRRLLDASVEVMGSKGYAGFRPADVADAAGVSRGAMTRPSPSKDDLVMALVEHVFERTAAIGRERAHRFDTI